MDKEKIKLDRMRYVKDSVPSNLAIIAVVFDILYFVLIAAKLFDPVEHNDVVA